MKTYTLALVASAMLFATAFLQCSSPTTSNPQADTELAINAREAEPLEQSLSSDQNIDQTLPLEQSLSSDQPTTPNQPQSHDQPTPIDKPAPMVQPHAPAQPTPPDQPQSPEQTSSLEQAHAPDQPTPIDRPKLVDQPTPIDPAQSLDQPIPLTQPQSPEQLTPVAQPTSLMALGFTLKLLKASIEGTSTLHAWESQVTEIEGKGEFQMKDKLITSIQDAKINIAVKGLKSKEGDKMDKKTYETFNSDEHPFITYTFSHAAVNVSASKLVTIEASGMLSMAGTSKPVSLTAKGKELANGDLQLSVSKTIKMTDYNMEPPVMFLGTIKVGDEITVRFDFELSPLQAANSSN